MARLIGNKDYRVWVADRVHDGSWDPNKRQNVVCVTMTYCGGGWVDDEGHWVGGGCWTIGDHPNYRSYWGLRIMGIEEVGETRIRQHLPD